MKRTIFVVLIVVVAFSFCYAKHVIWDSKQKPTISLTEAQQRALEALAPRKADYYCLSASVARSFSQCDWEMLFAATNQPQIRVSVGTDRVRVSEHGFNY